LKRGIVTESITVTDNRTGETKEIPIENGGIAAKDFTKAVPGVWFYDPGFMATAAAESAITYLDGEAGILRYRGYPIEQLAEKSTYLEVAYLLLHGELPTADEFALWEKEVTYHTYIHENVRKRFLEGFNYDAHPMGMLVSAIAALSTYYKDAKNREDADPGRGGAPLLGGYALRLPGQLVGLHPELSLDDVEGRRAALRGRPHLGPGPRRVVHFARRPRAELRHDRDAYRGQFPR
jgi:citrate synthase